MWCSAAQRMARHLVRRATICHQRRHADRTPIAEVGDDGPASVDYTRQQLADKELPPVANNRSFTLVQCKANECINPCSSAYRLSESVVDKAVKSLLQQTDAGTHVNAALIWMACTTCSY